VAVFADPVFSADDLRVGKKIDGPGSPSTREMVETSAAEIGITSFERLWSSRTEANTIQSLSASGDTLAALDFNANRDKVLTSRLEDYRVLHFATHSLINSSHPELSGIVLSLVDANGNPQNGFLRMNEIYSLKLRSELVVLSACETALGKDVRGEGLIGLTRGFMYAGSPRVIASLWRVPDRATSELMKRFYEGLFRGGLRPAAALRAAQLDMRKTLRWSSPYYWAGFILQGEWQ
jgi:CHAT domain-containing protein